VHVPSRSPLIGRGDSLMHKLEWRDRDPSWKTRFAGSQNSMYGKLKLEEVRENERKHEAAMAKRLQNISQTYSNSVSHLEEITRQLSIKSKRCDLASCVVILPENVDNPAAAEDDKVNKYLKLLTRRSQFTFTELRKIFIDCRKHSKKPGTVHMDKAQFSNVVRRYGYAAEEISHHLFEIFDADNSGSIDFDEMILGLASLRPENLSANAEGFFKVIDIDQSGQVSRLELVHTLGMLDRAPMKEVLTDVGRVFALLQVHPKRNIEHAKFVHAFRFNQEAQEIFRKYLAVFPNENLSLSGWSGSGQPSSKGPETE